MLRLELQHAPPDRDDLITICCDALEAALSAGSMRRNGSALYYGTDGHWGRVVFCPSCSFCHAPELRPIEHEMEFVVVDGVRACGKCKESGHYARTCER
jgi:hypothetical protein